MKEGDDSKAWIKGMLSLKLDREFYIRYYTRASQLFWAKQIYRLLFSCINFAVQGDSENMSVQLFELRDHQR